MSILDRPRKAAYGDLGALAQALFSETPAAHQEPATPAPDSLDALLQSRIDAAVAKALGMHQEPAHAPLPTSPRLRALLRSMRQPTPAPAPRLAPLHAPESVVEVPLPATAANHVPPVTAQIIRGELGEVVRIRYTGGGKPPVMATVKRNELGEIAGVTYVMEEEG